MGVGNSTTCSDTVPQGDATSLLAQGAFAPPQSKRSRPDRNRGAITIRDVSHLSKRSPSAESETLAPEQSSLCCVLFPRRYCLWCNARRVSRHIALTIALFSFRRDPTSMGSAPRNVRKYTRWSWRPSNASSFARTMVMFYCMPQQYPAHNSCVKKKTSVCSILCPVRETDTAMLTQAINMAAWSPEDPPTRRECSGTGRPSTNLKSLL